MAVPLLRVRIANYASLRRELSRFQEIQRGAFSELTKDVLGELRDYAEAITHRRSGTLASSHRVYFDSSHQRGYVAPDPTFAADRGRGRQQSVEEYAAYEHNRGGSHAFYDRAISEYGNSAVLRGITVYVSMMPRGVHQ